jgi:hypothetical protein
LNHIRLPHFLATATPAYTTPACLKPTISP